MRNKQQSMKEREFFLQDEALLSRLERSMQNLLEVFKVTKDPDDLNTYKEDKAQYKKVLDEVTTNRMEKRKTESSEEEKTLDDIYFKLVGQVPIKKQKVNTEPKSVTLSEVDSGTSSILSTED